MTMPLITQTPRTLIQVYGEPSSGKTHFALSASRSDCRLVYFDCDGNAGSANVASYFQALGRKIDHYLVSFTPVSSPGVGLVTSDVGKLAWMRNAQGKPLSPEKFMPVVAADVEHNMAAAKAALADFELGWGQALAASDVRFLVLDSGTFLRKILVTSHYGNDGSVRNLVTQRDWGPIGNAMLRYAKEAAAADKVFIICNRMKDERAANDDIPTGRRVQAESFGANEGKFLTACVVEAVGNPDTQEHKLILRKPGDPKGVEFWGDALLAQKDNAFAQFMGLTMSNKRSWGGE